MFPTNQRSRFFSFRLGQTWPSFEKFRADGAKALSAIKNGAVATLTTKTGQYRIIEEQDFQQMYGLARDVDRLRGDCGWSRWQFALPKNILTERI